MENREAIASLKTLCNTCTMFPKCVNNKPECFQAIEMAISALEKQEQTNAQSVNSMRTSRPNALESLTILEQAKDDKGCVPMSLVRQAFRNILEQTKEAIPHRNYQYLSDYWCECGWHLGKKGDVKFCADCGRRIKWD